MKRFLTLPRHLNTLGRQQRLLWSRELAAVSHVWNSGAVSRFSSEGGSGDNGGFFSTLKKNLKEAANDEELKKAMEDAKQTKVGGKSVDETKEELKQKASSASQAFSKFQDAAKSFTGATSEKFKETYSKASSTAQERMKESEFYQKSREQAEQAKQRFNESSEEFKQKTSDFAEQAEKAASTSKYGKMWNFTKEVMAGVFGVKRGPNRDGEPYPWIEYENEEGKIVYRNQNNGIVTQVKPPDFDALAPANAKITVNKEATDMMVVDVTKTRWERITDSLKQTPLIRSMLDVSEQISESDVGKDVRDKVAGIGDRAKETSEDFKEKWETSQHPLVYNMSYAWDSMFAETEMGQVIKHIRQLDADFDEVEFVKEMKEEIVPAVVRAFLRGDKVVLSRWLTESALKLLSPMFKAREAENVTLDDTVLSVGHVDIAAAKAAKNEVPVIVVSTMVQQINCMKNKAGDVVEGGEDEIRAVYYVFAMQRVYDEKLGEIVWKVAEMSIVGSTLYL